jgi:hypothetical protein
MTREIGIAPRYGGGLLVVVHVQAPRRARKGATPQLLSELAELESSPYSAVAAHARALTMFLKGYTGREAGAEVGKGGKDLAKLAYHVQKKGVVTLVRTYGPQLRRGMSPELRAELGLVAEETGSVGRVARAVCLYVDGAEAEAALADAGISYLHMDFLTDQVKEGGVSYLRRRFRGGSGWRNLPEGVTIEAEAPRDPSAIAGHRAVAGAGPEPPPQMSMELHLPRGTAPADPPRTDSSASGAESLWASTIKEQQTDS